MKLLHVAVATGLGMAWAACPNQCSGKGYCDANDRCVCFRGPGTKGNLRPMYTGADCSQRVCPYGDSHDFISDQGQQLQPVQYGYDSHYGSSDPFVGFLPAVPGGAAPSRHHMHAFLNNGFLLNRDLGLDVKVVSVNNAGASSSLVFQWKLNTEKTYNQEQTLSYNNGAGAYLSQASAYHVKPDLGAGAVDSGLYIYFDLTATDFSAPTVYAGDRYFLNVTFNEGRSVRPNDDNTVHPVMECSGRGACDRVTGTCKCSTGFTGDSCSRVMCPSACSGHGTCQSLQFFYDEGRGGNGDVYGGIEANQQYGCKCDAGFRGPACDQMECPSGPDPLGGDGGAEGRDCSGRGTCDYTSGQCTCAKGFYGEACNLITNLV